MSPQENFKLAAFESFAEESEGARLRLAARIAAGGRDLDEAKAHATAGVGLALGPLLAAPPVPARAAPTPFPPPRAPRPRASGRGFPPRPPHPRAPAALAH